MPALLDPLIADIDKAKLSFVVGAFFLLMGDIGHAVSMLEGSLTLGESARTHAALADGLFELGKIEGAITHLEAATRLDPELYPAEETVEIIAEMRQQQQVDQNMIVPFCLAAMEHLSQVSPAKVKIAFNELSDLFRSRKEFALDNEHRYRVRSLQKTLTLMEVACYSYVAARAVQGDEAQAHDSTVEAAYMTALAIKQQNIN